ncbi:hypothetical protein [Pseudoxanthomonas sp. 10H]|uniref:hypothetical protein n=1 Tax=Pseudoxanthomonas sp. 10H TaxID=3242729 RepID=UPI003558627A
MPRPTDRREPLYRSVNTRTHGVRHGQGGEYRHTRHARDADADATHASMHGRQRHGRDYTPLFRFLLSKVGRAWDEVFAEAKARLDTTEPVFLLVARTDAERRGIVRVGESSYFSGLYVDARGVLCLVDPGLDARDMQPDCACCTHTFNGVRFGSPS